jgi:hypothetical protein
MPRLQVQPRGLFPDISFGREPSNSTGGTFTHVAAGFPGARPKTAVQHPITQATQVAQQRASSNGRVIVSHDPFFSRAAASHTGIVRTVLSPMVSEEWFRIFHERISAMRDDGDF